MAAASRSSCCCRRRWSPRAAPLRALELGDDAAYGSACGVERARSGCRCSPSRSSRSTTVGRRARSSFVALMAPQIARRIARTAGADAACAALTGAVLVLGADVAAQRLVPETPLPSGS